MTKPSREILFPNPERYSSQTDAKVYEPQLNYLVANDLPGNFGTNLSTPRRDEELGWHRDGSEPSMDRAVTTEPLTDYATSALGTTGNAQIRNVAKCGTVRAPTPAPMKAQSHRPCTAYLFMRVIYAALGCVTVGGSSSLTPLGMVE
ncbi:hypothetical protein RB195_012268 [Necator americanus]|uniref:Uncharacterized protein n=1 Tax=Necator americanus TaxID=51031 RepID=A0ABR1D687_NECAM